MLTAYLDESGHETKDWMLAAGAGGFTSVDARSVGTSGAATVLQTNMRQNTTHQRDILWLPASNRVRIGSSTMKSSG
jgi:hypothetical protein